VRSGAIAFLIAAFLWGTARGASFDPALTWRTLDTPHFHVTFHGGEEQLAEEASLVLEYLGGDDGGARTSRSARSRSCSSTTPTARTATR
jgi:hypothetical protein